MFGSVPGRDSSVAPFHTSSILYTGQKRFERVRAVFVLSVLLVALLTPFPSPDATALRESLNSWCECFLKKFPELRQMKYRDFIKESSALRNSLTASIQSYSYIKGLSDNASMLKAYQLLVRRRYRHDLLTIDELRDYVKRLSKYENIPVLMVGDKKLRGLIQAHPALALWLGDPRRLQKALRGVDTRGELLEHIEALRDRFASERVLWKKIDKEIAGWRQWSWKTWRSMTDGPSQAWSKDDRGLVVSLNIDPGVEGASNQSLGAVINRIQMTLPGFNKQVSSPLASIIDTWLYLATLMILLTPILLLGYSVGFAYWKRMVLTRMWPPEPSSGDSKLSVLPATIVTWAAYVMLGKPICLIKNRFCDMRREVLLNEELSRFHFLILPLWTYWGGTYVSWKWVVVYSNSDLYLGTWQTHVFILTVILLAVMTTALNLQNRAKDLIAGKWNQPPQVTEYSQSIASAIRSITLSYILHSMTPYYRSKGRQPMRILFLAANPLENPLDLEKEIAVLEIELQGVRFRQDITFIPKMAIRPDDIIRYIRSEKPSVIHFSGHGSKGRIILRSDDDRRMIDVADSTVKSVLEGRGVDLLVLNACHTGTNLSIYAKAVRAVVGTTDAVDDEAARRFSAAFYRTIGNGESIREAFRDGCNAVAIHGFREVYKAYGELDLVLLSRSKR